LSSARVLADAKGDKVVVLAVGEMTVIADYFVIASGTSQRHVKALADRVLEGTGGGRKPSHIEGYKSGYWILLDYGDVVVDVFREAERAFYGLERLWGDAPRLEWEEGAQEAGGPSPGLTAAAAKGPAGRPTRKVTGEPSPSPE
jgi:ribosome-associated protein